MGQAEGAGGPVDVDQAATEGEARGEAVGFEATTEAEILDHLHAEGFEAADLFVGRALDQVEGADADGIGVSAGVRDAPGTGSPEAADLDEAEDDGLVPAPDDEGG